MGLLFDLPELRSSKEADKKVARKKSNKLFASTSIKGNGILDTMMSIRTLVQTKLGKYEDRYDLIQDEQSYLEYIDKCVYNGIVSIDTETTGLDPLEDRVVGVCLYTPGCKAVYVPVGHISYIEDTLLENQLSKEVVAKGLEKLNNIDIIMFNAKFDLRFILNTFGVGLTCTFDTYIAARLLNENEKSNKLKVLHCKYCLDGTEDAWSFDDLFKGVNFSQVPLKVAYLYAARDAEITYELYKFQLQYLTKGTKECEEQELTSVCDVFWDIEMKCLLVLAEMENTGVCFDLEYANELSAKYSKMLDESLEEFYFEVDKYSKDIEGYKHSNPNNKLSEPINVASPTQLAVLFYDILKLESPDKKAPRGTGVGILEQFEMPIAKSILKYRKLEKLLSTYIDKLPKCINKDTKRIHCSFNQYGAATGRMSSSNPNLQNIPSKNKDIRKMFIASEGCVLLSSDYSQQEPKLMTQMCQDEKLLQSYRDGKDLYAQIASMAFNKSYEDCMEFILDEEGNKTEITNKEGKSRRTQAKSILLGILYGRGINSVAEQLKVTPQKAQQIQDSVFKGFPAIKKFEQDTINMARNKGYVTTFWGRKRRLPDMQLNDYEISWRKGYGDIDPLCFDKSSISSEVPQDLANKFYRKLKSSPFKSRKIISEAYEQGIQIVDNRGKIADATRQCVNSRIQGSASDLTKLAAIEISKCERLRELGFKLLIPVHDEFIAECPLENANECAYLFRKCMSDAAVEMDMPISTDVVCSREWYGAEIEI